MNPLEYLRDVLLLIVRSSDAREPTPYGSKAQWTAMVAPHRASIVERLVPARKG